MNFRPNEIAIGGDSTVHIGTNASVAIALPTLANGNDPRRVLLTYQGSGLGWFNLTPAAGVVTAGNGTIVHPAGGWLVVRTVGNGFINVLASTGDLLSITPLDD